MSIPYTYLLNYVWKAKNPHDSTKYIEGPIFVFRDKSIANVTGVTALLTMSLYLKVSNFQCALVLCMRSTNTLRFFFDNKIF